MPSRWSTYKYFKELRLNTEGSLISVRIIGFFISNSSKKILCSSHQVIAG